MPSPLMSMTPFYDNESLIDELSKKIRQVKIDALLGKKSPFVFLTTDNIPKKFVELGIILSKYGAITGSLLYKIHGLINRNPNDIDLLVDAKGLENLKKKYTLIENEEFYEPVLNINSVGGIKIGDYLVDVILVDELPSEKWYKKIRLDNITHSIDKKIEVAKNRHAGKDSSDLRKMLDFLNDKQVEPKFEKKTTLFDKIKQKTFEILHL